MRKAIGILGGMGPEASVYMYKMLIDLSINEFGARNNDNFPEIVLHSIPVPDFISSEKKKGRALMMLKRRVKQLNQLDIMSFGIACNTAHILLEEIKKVSKAPFISMIEEVAKIVTGNGVRKIGILGTPSTIRLKLYQKALEKNKIVVVEPVEDELQILESVIRNVIAGSANRKDQKALVKVAKRLKKEGAEGIVLGCTELPLVFPKQFFLPVFNSVEILALELLKKYYEKR